jgi:chromosomal replication initiation ATPase DnaA
MPEYRAYIIGSDGHFQSSVPLICPDDETAKDQAKQLVDGHDVEIVAVRPEGRRVRAQVLMSENNDRRELERRLEQVRRLSNLTNDALTRERLEALARDIEAQLTK